MEKNWRKNVYVCIFVELNYFDVHLKLTRRESILLQFKKKALSQ